MLGLPERSFPRGCRPVLAAFSARHGRQVDRFTTNPATLPADPEIGPLVYEVFVTRYEKKATIVTSSKSLTEWGRVRP